MHLLALAAALLPAQELERPVEPLRELRRGPDAPGGWVVRLVGDVDQDGFADFVVGAPGLPGDGAGAGLARVVSGRTGEPLHVLGRHSPFFGHAVDGAGDVDGDGSADILVADPWDDRDGPGSGSVRVYSGRTGRELLVLGGGRPGAHFGFAAAGAGDVDQDGMGDIVVGAPFDGGAGAEAGRVAVFSGRTGELLFERAGNLPGDRLGWSVSGAGDVDGDRSADVIAGAPQELSGGSGYALLLSGRRGRLLHVLEGEAPGDLFGWSTRGAGDVDSSGMGDVIVGAPRARGGAGAAVVVSGRKGEPLHGLRMPVEGTSVPRGYPSAFGFSVSGAGDVDGDGFADLVVGAPRAGDGRRETGAAVLFSGRTGAPLRVLRGRAPGEGLGIAVSGAGDLDADGFGDVLVASSGPDPRDAAAGIVRVYSGRALSRD